MNLLRRTVLKSLRKSFLSFCFLLLFQAVLGGSLSAQDCSVFVNPSDGSDLNNGTQFQPLQSFESGFNASADGGVLCLAAGEYFKGADADGIILSDPSKSVTARLQSFGGSSDFLISEDFLVADLGSGTLSFERSGSEQISFGIGLLNSDALSPGDLNFLHTFEVRSGTLDFSDIPVTFQESVGNTLYISPDNSDKSAPASASISFGGALLGSDLNYSSTTRQWNIDGGASSQSRTFTIPSLLSGSSLLFSNSDDVTIANEIVAEGGASVTVSSSMSGSVAFPGGIGLEGGSSFSHSAQQNLSLSARIFGSGRAQITLAGTGVQTLESLVYEQSGELDLTISGGETLFSSATTVNGSLDVSSVLRTQAPVLLASSDASGALFTLSGLLDHGQNTFTVSNADTDSASITVSETASITGSPLTLSGAVSISGGGSLEISPVSGSQITFADIEISNALSLTSGLSGFISSSDASFPSSLRVDGGSLSIASSVSPSASGLTLTQGVLTANNAVFRLSEAFFSVLGGTIDLGIEFVNASSASLSSNSTLSSLAATNSTLSVIGTAAVTNDCMLENANLTVTTSSTLSCGTFLTSQSNQITLDDSAALAALNNMDLSSAGVNAGSGTSIQISSTLTLGASSSTLHQTDLIFSGANHTVNSVTPSLWKSFNWLQAGGLTNLNGDIGISDALVLSGGVLNLEPDAVLRLRSDLTSIPGSFTFSESSRIVVEQSSILSSGTETTLVLPSIYMRGSALSFPGNTVINGTLEQISGNISFPDNMRIDVLGDLTFTAGGLSIGDGSTLSGAGSTSIGGSVFSMGSNAILIAQSGADISPATASVSDAVLRLEGTGPLAVDPAFSFRDWQVAGDQVVVTVTGNQSFSVANSLTVSVGATLDLAASSLVLGSSGTSPSIGVDGEVTGTTGGRVTIRGISASWSGTGIIQDLHVQLDDVTSALTYSGAEAKLGRSLFLESGILDVDSAWLRFLTSTAIDLALNIDGEMFSGSISTNNLPGLNPESTPIDLSIAGTVSGFPSVNPYFEYGPVRHLTIAATDGLNTPPLFGLSSTLPRSISGSLIVESNALFQIPNIILTGANTVNRIAGSLPSLELRGSGSLQGQATGSVDALQFSGSDYQVTDLKNVRSFQIESGSVTLDGSETLEVSESLTLDDGSSLALGTKVLMNPASGAFNFSVGSANVSLGAGSQFDFAGQTAASVQPLSVWTLNDAEVADGYLVFRNNTTLSAAATIPRIRMVGENADVFLQNDLSISSALTSESGILRLGGSHLSLIEARWAHAGTQFQGDQSAGTARVTISGSSSVALAAPLSLDFANLDLNPLAGTITFEQASASANHAVIVPNGQVTIGNGNVSLGSTDLVLTGNDSPVLSIQDASILGDVSYEEITTNSSLDITDDLFPFSDRQIGEIVLSSGTEAPVQISGTVHIDALRLEKGTSFVPGSSPLQVNKRLVFGQEGAHLGTNNAGEIILAGGAQIVRRGSGTLSHAPTFLGEIDLAYDLDDGSQTGVDRNFLASILNSGFEIPPVASGIRNLVVLAGNTGTTVNRIAMQQNLSISGTAIVWNGELDWGSADVSFGENSSLGFLEIDTDTRASFSGGGSFTTASSINLFARPLTGSVTLSDSFFPSGIQVDSLEMDLGSAIANTTADLVLHATRNVGVLIVHGTDGSSLNMTGNSLTASRSFEVLGGTVFSDPPANIASGDSLFVGPSAVINGNTLLMIAGNSVVNGNMQALSFTTAGDLVIGGRWDSSTSLSMTGGNQEIRFDSEELVFAHLDRTAVSSSTAAVFRGPAGSTLRVTGSIGLNSGLIVLDNPVLQLELGVSIDRHPSSWVVGPVNMTVSGGFTGSTSFPVGSVSKAEILDLTFTEPLLATSAFQVEQFDHEPVIETGLPSTIGSTIVQDTDLFSWTLTSSVNFANAQPFSLSASAESAGEAAVTLLTYPTGKAGGRWETDVFSSSSELRSAILTEGLSPRGLRISPGLTTRNGGRSFIQFADDWVEASTPDIDIFINEELWLSDVSQRSASDAIPISESALQNDGVLITISGHGEPRVAGLLATDQVSMQPDQLTYLVLGNNLPGIPAIVFSPPMPIQNGLIVANLGSPESELTVTEMWPTARTFAHDLTGRSFSQEISTTDFSSAFRIQTPTGGESFSKFQIDSVPDGLSLFMVYHDLTSAVLTADGTLHNAIDATNDQEQSVAPESFVLHSIYPNPARTNPAMKVDIPEPGTLAIEVFDVTGRRISQETFDFTSSVQNHELTTRLGLVSSGMYLMRTTFRGVTRETRRSKTFVIAR